MAGETGSAVGLDAEGAQAVQRRVKAGGRAVRVSPRDNMGRRSTKHLDAAMDTKRSREGLEIGSACEHESDSKLTEEIPAMPPGK